MLIELTPSGRTTADTISQTLTDLEQRAFTDLPPAAVTGFYDALRALTDAAS